MRTFSFDSGNRDNTIFHNENCLLKGSMASADIQYLLTLIATILCVPYFSHNKTSIKIQSALKRVKKRGK